MKNIVDSLSDTDDRDTFTLFSYSIISMGIRVKCDHVVITSILSCVAAG